MLNDIMHHTTVPLHPLPRMQLCYLISCFSSAVPLTFPNKTQFPQTPAHPHPTPRSNLLHLLQNYETDELTEEMAHLEGLMKDLNAITTA